MPCWEKCRQNHGFSTFRQKKCEITFEFFVGLFIFDDCVVRNDGVGEDCGCGFDGVGLLSNGGNDGGSAIGENGLPIQTEHW